ncbi:hypothetical protein [Natronococcus jeotgali]|uniref:DUF8119 domain-containing protein n=1 Tax=Natronococcus jeotgali DSM 18795 TaxID=1227498 RepID=L9WVH5_9EURY|nr:hypothetical protein [Natronococcus jeotgali]ELY52353.1 hypothetical protein C492_19514 [Natronococcus jeotgali DSM 18795]
MEPDTTHEPATSDDRSRPRRALASLAAAVGVGTRIALDALVVGIWVLFLTLLFLSTNWPRWLFYALLLGGVGLYVQFTAWWGGSTAES